MTHRSHSRMYAEHWVELTSLLYINYMGYLLLLHTCIDLAMMAVLEFMYIYTHSLT